MIPGTIINMPSTGWHNPFVEMERMARQLGQLSRVVLGRSETGPRAITALPAVNVTEDDDRYYIRAEMPGIQADELDLRLDGRRLSISGARHHSADGHKAHYHRRERASGKIARVLELPGDIDTDRMDAEMVNGILKVTLAKSEKTKPKQIIVH